MRIITTYALLVCLSSPNPAAATHGAVATDDMTNFTFSSGGVASLVASMLLNIRSANVHHSHSDAKWYFRWRIQMKNISPFKGDGCLNQQDLTLRPTRASHLVHELLLSYLDFRVFWKCAHKFGKIKRNHSKRQRGPTSSSSGCCPLASSIRSSP